MVESPVIHVIVPSATVPASRASPCPARRPARGARTPPSDPTGENAFVVTRSPALAAPRRAASASTTPGTPACTPGGGRTNTPTCPRRPPGATARSQEQAVPGRRLHGQRLLRQHHRVPRVHGHDARAQSDPGTCAPATAKRSRRPARRSARRRRGRTRLLETRSRTRAGNGFSTSSRLPMRNGLAMASDPPHLVPECARPPVYANPRAGASDLSTLRHRVRRGGQLARHGRRGRQRTRVVDGRPGGAPGDAASAVAAEVLLARRSSPPTSGRSANAARRHVRPRAGRPRLVAGLCPRWYVRCGPVRPPWSWRSTRPHALRSRRSGRPLPSYRVVEHGAGTSDAVAAFASAQGWPLVLKAARGGYDGKGVWPVADEAEAAASSRTSTAGSSSRSSSRSMRSSRSWSARRPSGDTAAWPAVETAQVGGVCREVLVPGRLPRGRRGGVGASESGSPRSPAPWRHGGRALLVGRPPPGQRGGHTAAQLRALDDRGIRHVTVREPRPRRAGPAPGIHRAPIRPVASVNVFGGPAGEDPFRLLAHGLGHRGCPRAPLWQGAAAGTQTGTRDRLRRRPRRLAPGPGRRRSHSAARARRHDRADESGDDTGVPRRWSRS